MIELFSRLILANLIQGFSQVILYKNFKNVKRIQRTFIVLFCSI